MDRLRDREPTMYTIIEEHLNLLADATAEWADAIRSPSAPVVAKLDARIIL